MDSGDLSLSQLFRINGITAASVQNGVVRELSGLIECHQSIEHFVKPVDWQVAVNVTVQWSQVQLCFWYVMSVTA